MKRFYSQTTRCTYLPSIHGKSMPVDAVAIPDEVYESVIANPEPGKIRIHDANGLPLLADPPVYIPTLDELCLKVDQAADAARYSVAGDPLRAVEYERAAAEAQAFAAAGYNGDVPPMVAAWAINGRTAQEAADNIIIEAAQYTAALELIRTTRLAAKEQIRSLMAAGETEQAQAVADQTVAAINSAVEGIGNNAS